MWSPYPYLQLPLLKYIMFLFIQQSAQIFLSSTFWYLFSPAALKVGGKKICKQFVQKGLGLASEDTENNNAAVRVPLIVCITRLVAQKGLHLIRHAIKLVEQLVSDPSSTT